MWIAVNGATSHSEDPFLSAFALWTLAREHSACWASQVEYLTSKKNLLRRIELKHREFLTRWPIDLQRRFHSHLLLMLLVSEASPLANILKIFVFVRKVYVQSLLTWRFWGFGARTKLLSLDIPAGVMWFITFGNSCIFTVLFNSFGVGVEDVVTVIFMLDCGSVTLVSDMTRNFLHNKLLWHSTFRLSKCISQNNLRQNSFCKSLFSLATATAASSAEFRVN